MKVSKMMLMTVAVTVDGSAVVKEMPMPTTSMLEMMTVMVLMMVT